MGFNETTYNIFKKKYNLPDYIKKENENFILEENPLYLNPNDNEFKVGKEISKMTQNEVLKFIGGKDNELLYPPLFSKRITVRNKITIKKENVFILINEVKDISNQKKLDGNYSDTKVSFIYNNNDKKNKYRIVKISDFSSLRLTYVSKSYYEKNYDQLKSQNNTLERKRNILSEI